MRHRRSAHLMAAVAVAAAACSGTASPPTVDAPTETPTPAAPADPSASPAESTPAVTGLRDLGAPVDLGDGHVVGATPDGMHLWVSSPVPGSDELGCEGSPFDVLWIVDPASGERRRAIDVPEADHPYSVQVLLQGAPDGRVALVSSCEGYLGAINVGDVTPDGVITNLAEIVLPPVDLRSWAIRWNPGGEDLIALGNPDSETTGVFLIDSTSGDWIDIDERPLDQWIPLGDGLVAELFDRRVNLVDADGVVVADFAGDEFVPSPTGLPALSFQYVYEDGGTSGTVSLVLPGGSREILSDREGWTGSFSADGSIAVWSVSDPVTYDTTIVLHDLATGRQVLIDDAWFSGATIVSGGVAYTSEGPDTEADFGDPIVRFRPWAT